MKIVIKSGGKIVRQKEQRNLLHFETQLKMRTTRQTPKTVYNRQREKRIPKEW